MAKVNYTNPIADMHGKLARTDKVIYRTRNGVQHAYVIKHPRNKHWSDKQTATRASFAELTQQVKAVYADPQLLEQYRTQFVRLINSSAYKRQLRNYLAQQATPTPVPYLPQPKFPKPPTTLYGFIFSSLAKQNEP